MSAAVSWQGSLFGGGEPSVDRSFEGLVRHPLDPAGEAWVEHVPGWLRGADAVLEDLVALAAWDQGAMTIYDKRVDSPRLGAPWSPDLGRATGVDRLIEEALSDRYGVPVKAGGMNLYRDGRDSVAWHGDRVLRTRDVGLVATVTLGEARPFLLRPKGGGRSTRFTPAHGDLLVMGGTCQRTWQHTVPKVARAGLRVSLTFRWAGETRAPAAPDEAR